MLSDYDLLVAPIVGWLLAQSVKFYLTLKDDGIDWEDLFASGGMPSSHTAFVTALATTMALQEGVTSTAFAIVFAFWGVVVYDAVGVRRATGDNTKVLRQILKKMKLKPQEAMHEALGHTPLQVTVGAFTGLLAGLLTYLLMN